MKNRCAIFIFLDLGYHTHYNIYPFIFKYHDFIFPSLYSSRYVSHIFIIYLSVEGHLSCFHFPAIVSKAKMNIAEQVSVK